MSEGDRNQIHAAGLLLEAHYGRRELEGLRDNWPGWLQYILESRLPARKFRQAWPEISQSWLVDLETVIGSTLVEMWEYLGPHGASETTVGTLYRIAKWYHELELQELRPALLAPDTLEAAWQNLAPHDSLFVTRIMHVLGGLPRFPASRAVWRVAGRHRWVSWYADQEEVQEYLDNAVRDDAFPPGQLAEWLLEVGEDFCGARPKCDRCPLQMLLGPDGPCEPDEST